MSKHVQTQARLSSILMALAAMPGDGQQSHWPPSLGERLGALADFVFYGAAYALRLRPQVARHRLSLALRRGWPRVVDDVNRGALSENLSAGTNGAAGPVPDFAPIPADFAQAFADPVSRDLIREQVCLLLAKAKKCGPVRIAFVANFFAGGGAEHVLVQSALAAADYHDHICILFTDRGPRSALPNLPGNITILDLENDLSEGARAMATYLLLTAMKPAVVHVINSDAGWRVLGQYPSHVMADTLKVGSVFALQFSADRSLIGYAAALLPAAEKSLDLLISDNANFINHGLPAVGLSDPAFRFAAVPTPCRLEGRVTLAEARSIMRQASRRPPTMNVVWAGRLDKEKRTDLLLEIARCAPRHIRFHIFGKPVLSGGDSEALSKLSNARMYGAYEDPLEWLDADPHAFLFTSAWEGMPNTLIEAGWLGLPIVASAVGGVTELIDAKTGWAVSPTSSALGYLEALDDVWSNPEMAVARTAALTRRVHERHTLQNFREKMDPIYRLEADQA